jgi:hypothetical protein
MDKQKNIKKSVIFLIVVVIMIVFGVYFYYKWNLARQSPQIKIQKETVLLLEKVSKLMLLPVGEEPTIATVSDPEVLKDQVFFSKAQKGDKVLIYTQAKKAILYSVSLNKIIDVSTLSISPQKSLTTNQTVTPTINSDN